MTIGRADDVVIDLMRMSWIVEALVGAFVLSSSHPA
jgi:hypothetical protein